MEVFKIVVQDSVQQRLVEVLKIFLQDRVQQRLVDVLNTFLQDRAQRQLVVAYVPAEFRPMRLCRYFGAGTCFKGNACTFAHGRKELHPDSLSSEAEACRAGAVRACATDPGADCGYCRRSCASVDPGTAHREVRRVVDVPVLLQPQFQQSLPHENVKVPQIQFIVRLCELSVVPQRWVLPVQTVKKIEIPQVQWLGG